MIWFEKFIKENDWLVDRMEHCDHGHLQYVKDDSTPGDSYEHVINPFHVEGSVWTHTMMVMNELKHYDFSFEMLMAAILHDIGKPDARDVVTKDDGSVRVRFFGHAGYSFYRAIDVLKDWAIPDTDRQHILNIISLHGEFYDFVRGDEVKSKQWTKLSNRFKHNLTLFHDVMRQVECDCNGRHTFKFEGRVDADEIAKELWENEDCFEKLESKRPEWNGQPVVTMLIGPPASGKSTWVEENKYDHHIISRDAIVMKQGGDVTYTEAWATVDHDKVNKIHNAAIRQLIKDKNSFIVDETCMSRKSRRKILCHVGKKYWKKAVVFATGYDEIMRRREAREGKEIPGYVMKNMIGSFVVPMYDEFDEIEWVF
jgi:predicted kinase